LIDPAETHTEEVENEIEIIPIKSKSSNTTTSTKKSSDDIMSKAELFKHLKVEELRKLAIAKLDMSEDDVKKLKKNELIKRLTQ
jgi:hypothetical protein